MRRYIWGGVGMAKTRPDQRLGGFALIFWFFCIKAKEQDKNLKWYEEKKHCNIECDAKKARNKKQLCKYKE